jgi:hypothetical protein
MHEGFRAAQDFRNLRYTHFGHLALVLRHLAWNARSHLAGWRSFRIANNTTGTRETAIMR